jgi:diacylglycerol O-acyltransferase / wax synthase
MADLNKTTAMSGVDVAWLRMDHPTNLMMITTIMTFNEPIAFDRLRETIEVGMLRFSRFRQCAVNTEQPGVTPHWEYDKSFDIRSHIHLVALPEPGDQNALQAYVSDLMSTPLDKSRPLWQMHLVEHFGNGCAVIGRFHHCIADGIALIHVLLSMTTFLPDAEIAPLDTNHRRRAGPLDAMLKPATAAINTTLKTTETLWHEGMEMLANPAHALDLVQLGTGSASALGKLLTMPPDPQTPFKGKLGVQKCAAWSQPIPLADVKAIGHFIRGTINDILLTAMTGALRRYLLERESELDSISIRAVVPVNLRPLEQAARLGNHFGLIFLDLPVGAADPLDRLIKLQESMDSIKSSPEAIVVFGILNAIGVVPQEVEKQAVKMFGSKATTVMTNVPGPRQTIYFAGKPVNTLMFWVPQSGRLGIGISIISYDSKVWLGVAVDAGLIPDPDRIIEGFHAEFVMLQEMVRRADHSQRRSNNHH